MRQLRDFTVENGLYYSIVHYGKKLVAIYEDRCHYKKIGVVHVPDYRPIKNYKSMGKGANHNAQVLKILKKYGLIHVGGNEKARWIETKDRLCNITEDEYEAVKEWEEGK